MNTSTNTKYLEGIAVNDYNILEKVYANSLPEVVKYVKKNSGDLEDAKDVFQEGILLIFRKVKEEDLVLTTSFHNFLFMICKRIWLKKLRKKGVQTVTFEDALESNFGEDLEDQFLKTQKWQLFQAKFQELTAECQRVLKMWFNRKSTKEIALVMDYTEDYAKRKKYKCKNTLTEKIQHDPLYKDLTAP
ncbi:MAG: sigma-70 family RNA polymerase sigma factor [Bacteroidota bacterium]